MGKILTLHGLAALSFILGVVGLGTNLDDQSKAVALFVGLALMGAAIYYEIRDRPKNLKEFKDKRHASKEVQAREYMKKVVNSPGSIAIFTRNMSWLDDEAYGILKRKAESRDLKIIMQSPTSKSIGLENSGADIIYYEDILPDPISSRFTIIDAGKSSATLSIGNTDNDKDVHRIQRFVKASDPALSLAKDMLVVANHAIKKSEQS